MRWLVTRVCSIVLAGLVAGACTSDDGVPCPEILRSSTLAVSLANVPAATVAEVPGSLCDADGCAAPTAIRVVDDEVVVSFPAAAGPVTYDLAFLDASGALLADARGEARGHLERPSGRRCPGAWHADVVVP